MPPWAKNPYRLWSLLDMLKINVPGLAVSISFIWEIEIGLLFAQKGGMPPELAEREARRIENAVTSIAFWIKEVKLSHSLGRQLERVAKILARKQEYDRRELEILFRELRMNFLEELTTPQFLMIPAGKRELYEQNEPPFGQDVAEKIPNARYDIACAARCLALDEWTAAVFHTTRVLEIGLRKLARRVNITGIENKDWYELIRDINDNIKALKNPGKALTPQQRKRNEWLSEMASGFAYFKDAWRNPVSHSRGKYDERDATSAWNHVLSFMQVLARGPR